MTPDQDQRLRDIVTDAVPPVDPRLTPSDDANALRLIDQHGDIYRRVSDMRRWFAWDGQRWTQDYEDHNIRQAAIELARQLPEADKDQKAYKRNSLSSSGISGAVRLAETNPRVTILARDLDSHAEVINTPGGVVDLRTGAAKPHEPSLLLTRITAYPADPDAPHPAWSSFLNQTFAQAPALIGYVQRLAGLALLGNVRDHILPFLHGIGANGKGVLTLVLQGLLGDADRGGYAVSAPDGFLMAGRDKHETEIARLRGARLVVCSEQTSGKRFDESKVKRLTGGDLLTGRYMRGDFFDFPPSHLLWVLSNHLPAVREGGPSFWRRVRLIPFLHVVPEPQRDPELHHKLLTNEGPAILGWAVRGAVDVLADGLQEPDAVVEATRQYEVSEDSLASFVQEECSKSPFLWCTVSDFRHRYGRHCFEMGAEPLTAKSLTMRLVAEFGVIATKHSQLKQRIYRGIEPLEDISPSGSGDR